MVTKKVQKHVGKAYGEVNKALLGNRLKSYQRLPLIQIKAGLEKWLEQWGGNRKGQIDG